MKLLKIKASEYGDLVSLLDRAGLVNHKTRTANPDRIFVNGKTYDKIYLTIRRLFKKQNPGITKNQLDYSVNMLMLNLAPSVCSEKGLMAGYALILPCKCEGTAD